MIGKTKIAIAVLASLMMLTVPLSVASDSDALVGGSTGAAFEGDDLTVSEIEALGLKEPKEIVNLILSLCDLNSPGMNVLESRDIDISIGEGYSVSGNEVTSLEIQSSSLSFKAEYIVSFPKDIPLDDMVEGGMTELKSYLGVNEFSIGDKLVIEGDGMFAYSSKYVSAYRDIDETHCIDDYDIDSMYSESTLHADITYYQAGSSEGKTFGFDYDVNYEGVHRSDYVYASAPVVGVNPCDVKYTTDDDYDISIKVTINGKTYDKVPIVNEEDPPGDYSTMNPSDLKSTHDYSSSDVIVLDDILGDADLEGDALVTYANTAGTVENTYAGVDRIFTETFGDSEDDGFNFLVFGIGVVVGLALVGLIVFILIKKGVLFKR